MARTGFKIIEDVYQFFNNGPISGSVVSSSYAVDLTVSPYSASLNEEEYFNRSLDPLSCTKEVNGCLSPLLTSLNTGSQRGYFDLYYTNPSSLNSAVNISASVSTTTTFEESELFSGSISSPLSITSSYVSGTLFFNAYVSCSGTSPDRSPDSSLISYTFDELIPETPKGNVNLQFVNNLSSPMEVQIRSRRGNNNYVVDALSTLNYDYSRSPVTGSWSSALKSPDLDIVIRGGARSTYGNHIQRRTVGLETLTYTTGNGFSSPNTNVDSSNTFSPDSGISFTVRQLTLPPSNETTTTIFSLVQVPPPISGSSEITDRTITPTIRFGSTPLSSEINACSNSNINFKEITYFQFGGYLYNTREDAESKIRSSFPFNSNYILTAVDSYLKVNKEGFIQETATCQLPSLNIDLSDGAALTQREACSRTKSTSTSQTYTYKDNKLTGDGRDLSGRYPLNNNSKGGSNVILSTGNIIGFETCGTELSPIQLSIYGYPSSSYPFDTPEIINPETLAVACGDNTLTTYYQDLDGVIYYDFDGSLAYDLVGDGGSYYKNNIGEFLLISNGLILSSSNPC